MIEQCVLLLSCVLAVTSVLTGYVCEIFVESICNVFRFCDFLFTIPDDAWRFVKNLNMFLLNTNMQHKTMM